MDAYNLPIIYFGLIILSALVYAILDGYDLGVGMLLPMKNKAKRDRMIASIGPFWDANETWLVLIVGLLFIAFPKAHSLILYHLYFPIFVMIVSLIIRGIAFDFRAKAKVTHRLRWDYAFKVSSAIAALSQGYMLGRYIMAFDTSWQAYLFAALSAYGVAAAYFFIGATWLVLKTEGDLQQSAVRWARYSGVAMFAGIITICVVNPLVHQEVFLTWFSQPLHLIVPITCAVCYFVAHNALNKLPNSEDTYCSVPFFMAAGIFTCCAVGLALSCFPYIVPHTMSIWQVASASESLAFLLVGASVVIPTILIYTGYSYWVFRGKTKELSYN